MVTTIGSYATYQVAGSHIQNRLVERSRLLASAINHSAMIAPTDPDLQHVIGAVLNDNADIRTIAIMLKDGQKVIASATVEHTAFSETEDEHHWHELVNSIGAGDFGFHVENNLDLVLIAPLWRAMSASDMHVEVGDQASAHSNHDTMPDKHRTMGDTVSSPADHAIDASMSTAPGHGNPSGQSHAAANTKFDWITQNLSESDYRGGILLRVDRSDVIATMSNILWGLMPISVSSVLAILALAYVLLHFQVISPIGGIRHVMKRQQSGDREARVVTQSTTEFDEVAVAFNGMIDAILEREGAEKKLTAHRDQLQKSVDMATQELQEANERLEQRVEERTRTLTQEIGERKRAEEALRESEERFRAVVDNSPTKIHIKDLDGRYTMVNRQSEILFGVTEEEARGRTSRDIFPKEVADSFAGHDQRVVDSGETIEGEEEWVQDDGVHTFLTVKFPIRGATGEIVAVGAIGTDITERKRAEEEVRRLNTSLEGRVARRTAELEAANKEMEAFSYSVSHDLRAPLRTIDGFSRILLEEHAESLDDKGKKFLQRIRAGSQKMGQLIDAVLQLSRLARGDLKRKDLDLSKIVDAIAGELKKSEPDRDMTFKVARGVTADGDEQLIKVALQNLLGNAVKYTGRKDQARIEFGVTNGDGRNVYFVRDNGAGFDMSYADKLFAPFQRAHGTAEFEGMGIGLATVQRIINRHRGKVWAEAEVDKGATFFFTLSHEG